ncbi:MAG TPA: cobalt-precorrin-5B (C(1))-methyltransferase [Acidimicrobiales bacterium]|nr:cobalt-precorrin-5B (C(1))-methyltransferase [Acidimicrobiales bacterium]
MTGETNEPELSPDVAERQTGLRTGWTTGTCASAAAKAAVLGLATGVVPDQVEVGLPQGARVSFPVVGAGRVTEGSGSVRAAVIKDAGDDPDCTDGAQLTADVRWATDTDNGTRLAAGAGVGTITKPGLGLPVGAPAINPVPRRMILAALAEVTDRPVTVTFSVPGGEEMTKRTSNERLGILGGISILGTTGIVRPFSTAAYRASVVQQVDVASAQGERTMVLCTGSRSERAAQRLYPSLDPVSFVEVGDFSGIALRKCATDGMSRVNVVAMAGKITKLAAGVMMTHFHRSKVDTDLLAAVAAETGSPAIVIAAATETATARHFYDACVASGVRAPLLRLCQLARDNCIAHGGGVFECEVVMVDFEGDEVMARA